MDIQERLYSVVMTETELSLLDRFFSESYGDIDKEAPDDPYYHKGLKKWGKRIGLTGAGIAATGAGIAGVAHMAGGNKGDKVVEKLRSLGNDLRSYEFHGKDHFGHLGEEGFIGDQARKNKEKFGKLAEEKKEEIKKLVGSNKKYLRARGIRNIATSAAALGTAAALVGGGLYLGAKHVENSRKTGKKDLKDVLVQADRDKKKNK